MITEAKSNPKEFVIALYSRPNESFPAKLDVMVNGHVGILEEGRPCILPRFLVNQALMVKNFTHRERSIDSETDTYETIPVRPNIDVRVIAEEYQSPEGIQKLLKDASQIKDVESPYYRLRLGVKNLVYGDMKPAEQAASEAIKHSPKAIDMEAMELKAKLYEKDKQIDEQNDRLARLESLVEKALTAAENPAIGKSESGATTEETPVYEFNGKTYKTEAAMKTAMSKAKKAEAEAEAEPAESDDTIIEVDV